MCLAIGPGNVARSISCSGRHGDFQMTRTVLDSISDGPGLRTSNISVSFLFPLFLSLFIIDPFKSIFKNRKNRNRFNRFKSI